MKRKINLDGKIVDYNLNKNSRAKNISLSINLNGQVRLTMPKYFPIFLAEKFIKQKSKWLLEKIAHLQNNKSIFFIKSKNKYLGQKESALILIKDRVDYFNQFYNFSINKIVVKNQSTRWGSCSTKKNLNFNYKLIYLPEKLRDYIIVHELCHLKEMNHSVKFWMLVNQTIPGWKKIRKELKNHIF